MSVHIFNLIVVAIERTGCVEKNNVKVSPVFLVNERKNQAARQQQNYSSALTMDMYEQTIFFLSRIVIKAYI